MACGAVMVPTTMFMGQVVTPFAPQQTQNQTISIGQQAPTALQEQQGQTQVGTQPQSQNQTPLSQTQFLQVSIKKKKKTVDVEWGKNIFTFIHTIYCSVDCTAK